LAFSHYGNVILFEDPQEKSNVTKKLKLLLGQPLDTKLFIITTWFLCSSHVWKSMLLPSTQVSFATTRSRYSSSNWSCYRLERQFALHTHAYCYMRMYILLRTNCRIIQVIRDTVELSNAKTRFQRTNNLSWMLLCCPSWSHHFDVLPKPILKKPLRGFCCACLV
jgi:hypothetical protein